MFRNRINKNELLDDLLLNNVELKKNLDEIEFTNNWFGSKKSLIQALNKIYVKSPANFQNNRIVIGDLGCGNGDLLRAVNKWAKSKHLKLELVGIDANPFIIQYAIEKSDLYPEIEYKTLNIFSAEFSSYHFDIICINSLCHHFDNQTLIELFKQLKQKAHLAIIINDLHRHWLSYFGIKCLSFLLQFSDLAKTDGPLSVLRSFHKQELIDLLHQADINNFEIQWAFIFRWQIIIWTKPITE